MGCMTSRGQNGFVTGLLISSSGRKKGCVGFPGEKGLTGESLGATEVTVRQGHLIPGALLFQVPGWGDRRAWGAGERAVARGGQRREGAERGVVLLQLVKLPLQQPRHGGAGVPWGLGTDSLDGKEKALIGLIGSPCSSSLPLIPAASQALLPQALQEAHVQEASLHTMMMMMMMTTEHPGPNPPPGSRSLPPPLPESLPRTLPGTFPTTSYNPPTHTHIHQTNRWTDSPPRGLAHSPTGILGADSPAG